MRVGSLESPVEVTNTFAVCYDSGELEAAVTSLTISSLNGDVDEEYRLILRAIGGSVADTHYKIRPNNDSGANYGRQNIYGSDTTVSAARVTTDTDVQVTIDANPQNNLQFSNIIFYAKSGYVRTFICKVVNAITGTTVTDVGLQGNSWNNTTDNIASLVVVAGQANGIGVGSRIILMKKVTSTSGMKTGALEVQGKVYGVWQKVYEDTLSSAQTSVTISGLDGNTDVMYRFIVRQIGGSVSASNMKLRLNNDSASNYGAQALGGENATATASRYADSGIGLYGFNNCAQNNISKNIVLLYAKSGYVRVSISESVDNVSGTSVISNTLQGQSWNNTADNITNLVFLSTQANGIGIGSYICLEKLNL